MGRQSNPNVRHTLVHVVPTMGGALTAVEGECAAGARIGFLLWERAVESEENNCKGVHSLMPNLGHVVDSGGLVRIRPGFHQRYEQARWDKRIGLG